MYRKSFIDTYLKNDFSFEEAKSEIDFILEILFDFQYKDFLLGKSLNNNQIAKIEKVIEERVRTKRPIQQILGQAFFYGRRFFVNNKTLIPRPETELLVCEVLELSKKIAQPKILDIGTGTGCIPITLRLENRNVIAHSVDVSLLAIEIAKKNALFHNVLTNISFFKSNLFENVNEKYNIIVSNPPYIPIKEKESLQTEVRDFDPALALFAYDELGIEFYKRIIENSKNYIEKNGYIAFELGINQACYVKELFEQNNFKDIKIVKDYNSIERVIIAKNDN